MQTLIGQKKDQSQRFLEDGKRIPVTLIDVKGNTIVAIKTQEKNHYQAVQLGFSMKRRANKAEVGHAKGAKLEKAPKFLREVKIVDETEALPEVGSVLNPTEIFEPGDIVDVSGVSKGKGFQGGVKRWGFHGGPKTHGQSDRHRAPGSIGQGTTPGRVYKGKKMAGNMGNDNVTIKNLEVVDITSDGVLVIKGLVPGIMNGMIMVEKVGVDKNFVPLYKTPDEKESEDGKVEAEAKADDQLKDEKVDENKEKEEAKEVKEDDKEKVEKEENADNDKTDSKEETEPEDKKEDIKDEGDKDAK